ncbi:MAG: transposase [Candidatus Saccharibacteria bacterium]|nr:transposase [Pseudorhodobacter sp.]
MSIQTRSRLVRGRWRGQADVCVEALNEAICKFRPPQIMDSGQGNQFTSFDWSDRRNRAKSEISLSAIARNRLPAMDGRKRPLLGQPSGIHSDQWRSCLDMSRLWRSLKYRCDYMHTWETGPQARAGVGRWITFYNCLRPHAIRWQNSLPDCFLILLEHAGQTPAVVYFNATKTDQQVQAVV